MLPVYYSDNYVSLTPHESKIITVEAAATDLHGDQPLVVLDGWNVDVAAAGNVALNQNAQVASWPETGISIKWFNGPLNQIKIPCGDWGKDVGYDLGRGKNWDEKKVQVDTSAAASPQEYYQNSRRGEFTYTLPMKPAAKGYHVRLYFAETEFNAPGKRVFGIEINNRVVLDKFDIHAAAGASNKAVLKEFEGILPDQEGNIRIHFLRGSAGEPKINAIEVGP